MAKKTLAAYDAADGPMKAPFEGLAKSPYQEALKKIKKLEDRVAYLESIIRAERYANL
jgi:hypothetical protein